MSHRWIQLFAITAILAVAAVASAQDHHDDSKDRHDRPSSHSSDHPSRSRASRDRSSSDSSRGSRPDDRSRTDDRSRGNDRAQADDRSRNDNRPGGGDRGGDSRPGGFDRGNDRANPFNRSMGRDDRVGSVGRRDAVVANPRGRAVLGVPVHDRTPGYWDGRGHTPETHFGPPPVHNSLSVAIGVGGGYRGTEVAVGAQIGGLRVGFVSYSGPAYDRGYGYGPRPGFGPGPAFGYGYYAYDPYVPGAVVVASPWYRYSYLPPYLDRSHVVIVDSYPGWNWDGWRHYDYEEDRNNLAVRDSVDDLRDAFEESSTRIADRLIPEEGNVAIFNAGKYDYSLNPDDFQKMFLDGIEQSKTVRYQILETRTRGDEVRIRARHTYTDSWGKEQSVVHTITLRRENGGDYVIREFGSE